jgi:phage baseplate assembly protein W
MARFKGFSTINQYKKFTLTDNELIKRDLLNALTIREGELPGRPSFGTRLWNFIFEPNTPDIVRQITAELERTTTYDPRVRIDDVIVTTDPSGVILELVVTFVPDLNPEVLQIKFDEESQTASFV